ncbi:hypothetical protein CYLTODRAFT_456826 [Cylindrobasidium torrendii FP15055 ss-10]|uniref:Uncharacterized protein n=1 Tax=Cylindrobasidium torrendii FP15055 ss-10 TaxID=1314674 RepID=A0A0D7B5S9_9AGAR|nr:hypothetical protein CYLTODRAFT_456826 [Cylindrobasidium torrendii FP15055 ss-10]
MLFDQGWKFRDDFGYEVDKRYLGTRSQKARDGLLERRRQTAKYSTPRIPKYYLKPPPN